MEKEKDNEIERQRKRVKAFFFSSKEILFRFFFSKRED